MSAAPPSGLVIFRSREWLQPLALVAVGLVAAFFLASGILALYRGSGPWQATFDFIAGALIVGYVFHSSRRALECDRAGLRFRSHAPWPLSALDPDWALAWPQIRGARWERGMSDVELVLDTASGARRLDALRWQVDLDEARSSRRALANFRRGRSGWFDPSILPLVRALRDRGVDVPQDIATGARASFDLAKNRASRLALLIAAAAVVLWFADASVSNQMYGRATPWPALGAFTAAMAIVFAVAQARSEVPPLANLTVTSIVAIALGLALYAGLQRANQLADRGGPRTVEFTLQRDGTLRSNVAAVRDLPPMFFGDAGFWAAQKPGSRHRFGYYRGLGFETLDIGEYRARLKAFYGRDPGRDIGRP